MGTGARIQGINAIFVAGTWYKPGWFPATGRADTMLEVWRKVQGDMEEGTRKAGENIPGKLFNVGAGQALLSIQLRPQGEGGNSAISSMFVWVPGCEGEASMPMPASTAGKCIL